VSSASSLATSGSLMIFMSEPLLKGITTGQCSDIFEYIVWGGAFTSPRGDISVGSEPGGTCVADVKLRLFEGLSAEVGACKACDLCKGSRNRVMGEGNLNSCVVFVGEAPGRREDETGRPFVGSAGKLLNRLISGTGLNRDEVFISNVVRCRPLGNRRPKRDEVEACSGHLEKLLGIIEPRVIAPMGNSAIEYLFERFKLGVAVIGAVHGKPQEVDAPWGRVVVFPLYHPAAAIYNRGLLRELEVDMSVLAQLFK
jgi:uracil-DNA glycosylase family 4